MIVSLQSTTFGEHGGIPTYNRLVCRVLNEISSNSHNHILIATDNESDIKKAALEFSNVRLEGFDRDRLRLILRFLRLTLTGRSDLVLLGHVNYAPLGWVLKQLRPQMRYGVILYGVEAWHRLPWMRRRGLQQADFVLSISDYTRQKAIQTNALSAESVFLVPNALEWTGVDSVTPAIESPPLAGTKLLSVCRLEKSEQYKGVDKVIEVLPEIVKRVPDVRYIVVGGGTDLERHKQLAEEYGIADRVHFLGFVDDEVLRACYSKCDLFVMPSAGEGFGFAFLEAMKYGKAVVAADSGGAPEVVQDEVTGRLVRYGDSEQLASALIDLCLDQNKRQRLGDAGYQRLQEKFTFSHFKQNLWEILQREMLSTHAQSSSRQLDNPV